MNLIEPYTLDGKALVHHAEAGGPGLRSSVEQALGINDKCDGIAATRPPWLAEFRFPNGELDMQK